jgi:Protein of unknown function (DUF2934)
MDERIRRRAYEIWEREGRPEGREAEHWRRAAEELAEPPPPPAESQEVPAARVRDPAKLDESAPPGPGAQSDPLGLAQPTAKAPPRRRNNTRGTKARTPESPPPGNSGNGMPDRSR